MTLDCHRSLFLSLKCVSKTFFATVISTRSECPSSDVEEQTVKSNRLDSSSSPHELHWRCWRHSFGVDGADLWLLDMMLQLQVFCSFCFYIYISLKYSAERWIWAKLRERSPWKSRFRSSWIFGSPPMALEICSSLCSLFVSSSVLSLALTETGTDNNCAPWNLEPKIPMTFSWQAEDSLRKNSNKPWGQNTDIKVHLLHVFPFIVILSSSCHDKDCSQSVLYYIFLCVKCSDANVVVKVVRWEKLQKVFWPQQKNPEIHHHPLILYIVFFITIE